MPRLVQLNSVSHDLMSLSSKSEAAAESLRLFSFAIYFIRSIWTEAPPLMLGSAGNRTLLTLTGYELFKLRNVIRKLPFNLHHWCKLFYYML